MENKNRHLISIVVPYYNESDNIEEFYNRICSVMSKMESGLDWELILINDGSRDNTLQKLIAIYNKDNRIKIIDLSRNFGKEIALTTGLDYAQGDAVIPIDTDLQDPPEAIEQLISKWNEGFDIVSAKQMVSNGINSV